MCKNYCISTRVTVGAALSEKKNGPVVTAPTGRHTVPSVNYWKKKTYGIHSKKARWPWLSVTFRPLSFA